MSGDAIATCIVLGVVAAAAAVLWLCVRDYENPWPWSAEARQVRKRQREFSDRVAKAMELGMNQYDATEAVRAERMKESAAARKAYEEANK